MSTFFYEQFTITDPQFKLKSLNVFKFVCVFIFSVVRSLWSPLNKLLFQNFINHVKMDQIDYSVRRDLDLPYRIVDVGHFNMHFWPIFKLLCLKAWIIKQRTAFCKIFYVSK